MIYPCYNDPRNYDYTKFAATISLKVLPSLNIIYTSYVYRICTQYTSYIREYTYIRYIIVTCLSLICHIILLVSLIYVMNEAYMTMTWLSHLVNHFRGNKEIPFRLIFRNTVVEAIIILSFQVKHFWIFNGKLLNKFRKFKVYWKLWTKHFHQF